MCSSRCLKISKSETRSFIAIFCWGNNTTSFTMKLKLFIINCLPGGLSSGIALNIINTSIEPLPWCFKELNLSLNNFIFRWLKIDFLTFDIWFSNNFENTLNNYNPLLNKIVRIASLFKFTFCPEAYLRLPKAYIHLFKHHRERHTQSAIICSKLTIETLEEGVKYVQS